MTNQTAVLTLDNITIKTDPEGRFCLNDLHKAAGGEAKHRPNYFMDRAETDDLRYELKKDWMERAGIPAVLTVTGRNGGTYVAKELVYAYAMWISPAFHLKVIRAYDRLATQGVAVHETGYRVTLGGMTTGRGGYRDTLGEGRTYGRQGQKSHLRRKAIATPSEGGYRHTFGEERSPHLQREQDQSRHLRSKEMETGSNE